MSLFVKICGINTVEAALAAAGSGANAVGFVFADSPRRVDPEEARAIGSELPVGVEKVAVFLRPSRDEVDAVLAGFDADTVQADWASLRGFTAKPILPVVREGEQAALDGKRLLFEGRRSGRGERANWDRAAELARRSNLILAGGLDARNVGGAITAVEPYGVDVSSGVEVRPGLKDPGMIEGFVRTVREIEREMVRK